MHPMSEARSWFIYLLVILVGCSILAVILAPLFPSYGQVFLGVSHVGLSLSVICGTVYIWQIRPPIPQSGREPITPQSQPRTYRRYLYTFVFVGFLAGFLWLWLGLARIFSF